MTAPVWFAVPEVFREIDLGEDPAARAAGLTAAARSLTEQQLADVVAAQELLVAALRDGDARYAAHIVGRVDGEPPRMSVGLFSVLVKDVHVGGDTLLDDIGARLCASGRRSGRVLELPAGRALAVVEQSRLTSTGTMGEPARRARTVWQVQVMLPFPGRRRLAVFALGTEYVRDVTVYLDIMGAVLRTVTFAAPADPPGGFAAGRIAATLGGSMA